VDDAVGGLDVRGHHVGVVDLRKRRKKRRREGGREGETVRHLSWAVCMWRKGRKEKEREERKEGKEGGRKGGREELPYLDTAAGDGDGDGRALHGHGAGQLQDLSCGHTA